MKLHGQCFVVYHADNEIAFFYIKSWTTCAYSVYFKSKKEFNYDIFVDPNILGATRLVHSDLRIYRISFFLLDRNLGISSIANYGAPRKRYPRIHKKMYNICTMLDERRSRWANVVQMFCACWEQGLLTQ